MPWVAWPSVLSLDAVIVAVVWQQWLMRTFCQRGSTWGESAALAATVWLIYVADRLLDAASLNLSRPHSLRHRFYRRHARFFLALWIVVLVVDTIIVVRFLPPQLIREGLVVAVAVLVYGASVHFRRAVMTSQWDGAADLARPSLTIPKEVRVGVLFAAGVSLSAWSELMTRRNSGIDAGLEDGDWVGLVSATLAMAILFTSNCLLVAFFERRLDRAQSFASVASGVDDPHGRLARAVGSRFRTPVLAASVIAFAVLLIPLPTPFRIVVLCCAFGLIVLAKRSLRSESIPEMDSDAVRSTFDVRGVWVDVVLWLPPVVMIGWFS